jgi:hypothetical protein
MKPYIKLPKFKRIPDSSIKKRKLTNQIWKEHIFCLLLDYYNNVDKNKIQAIIQEETEKKRSEIEKQIKQDIYKWLIHESRRCAIWGIIPNLEPSAVGNLDGFYDLKFQHSDWQRKYFSFEAKNLGKVGSISFNKSISEYVYVKKKNKDDDGGMYRYFIGKYACEMNFGGMIGFVIGKAEKTIPKLVDKIYFVYDKDSVGTLIDEKIIDSSIFGNSNTFDSIHQRKNYTTGQKEEFHLHHIIMDFT